MLIASQRTETAIIYGARVGRYTEHISHYNVLSTLLAIYRLPPLTEAAPIRTIWD
jgi:hypothetical protein